MAECKTILDPEPLWISRKMVGKLFLGRLRVDHVFGDKFHLLPHAATNDDIVAVQSSRLALTIENLVANVVFDEVLQFLLGWRATPCASEAVGQVCHARRGNDDLRGCISFLLVDDAEKSEQDTPEHEELKQRLPQQREVHGVYQIGDV